MSPRRNSPAATLLPGAVLALAGRREDGSAVAPVNAVRHRLWREEALRAQAASLGRLEC